MEGQTDRHLYDSIHIRNKQLPTIWISLIQAGALDCLRKKLYFTNLSWCAVTSSKVMMALVIRIPHANANADDDDDGNGNEKWECI